MELKEAKRVMYAAYLFGTGVNEELCVVEDRDLEKVLKGLPEAAYGVKFFDEIVATFIVDDTEVETVSRRLNVSGVCYVSGQVMSLEEAEEHKKDPGLAQYFKSLGYEKIVLNRHDYLQPFYENDTVV